MVPKLYGADTLTTTYKVEQALKEIQAGLPAGITMNAEVFRQATFIERSIDNLKEALIRAARLLSSFSLFFF